MKAIIIEDEKQARLLLKAMLKDHFPTIDVQAECEDLPTGVKAIRKTKPDVVFLDIEMPGHSGLELLEFFNPEEVTFQIIFTTAYSEYAVRAFKMSAVDYLLKPIAATDLMTAVERAQRSKNQFESLQLLKDNLSNKSKKLVINQSKGIEFVDSEDILFLKANGAYTEIHKQDGSYVLASKNLGHFEDLLKDINLFFRTQKSYIVNTKYISNIHREDGGFTVSLGNHLVSVSPDKVNSLIELMR